MTSLFGNDYKDLAANYSNKATQSEINEIISQVWDEYGKPRLEEESFMRMISMGYGWDDLASRIKSGVKTNAQNSNYDNLEDFIKLTEIFCESKKLEVNKLIAQHSEKNNPNEDIRKRADPNFREIPENIKLKFKEIGMEVYYNEENISLGSNRRNSSYYNPYERLFIKDEAGIGGKLYYARKNIIRLFSAQYTTKWAERLGSWWHMPASTDLNQLYEVIVG